ncbi:hypothetical protein [Micromonospora tulbaghiae]
MSTAVHVPARDLTGPTSAWSVSLTPREADELTRLASFLTANPSRDPEAFCRDAKRAARHLPKRVAEALHDFGRWGSVAGVLVFSAVPVGQVPATPSDNSTHRGEHTLLARIQALFNEFLGHMIAYEAEGHGRLFQDMVPSRTAAAKQTSLSSSVELELHTEQAFSMLRPDFLSLGCLRGDPDARTFVLTAAELITRLDNNDVALLREPRWITGVDESFRMGGQQFIHGDVRGPMPILSGSPDDPFIVLDQDLMRGTDPVAQSLLDRIIALYPAARSSYVLRAGDVLLLDNARAVHGRSPFEPRFDGADRFVVRSFVTGDLNRSRHARPTNGRVIAGRHS